MIAIIAVLAAMVSVGVMRALDTAKQTRIKTEVDQLDLAFKAYRDRYGSFPPCDLRGLGGSARLRAHVARAFPRYDITQLGNDLRRAGVEPRFRPDQALVFWLSGFNPDPAHPFLTIEGYPINNGQADTTVTIQRTPLFDFDRPRMAAYRTPGFTPTASSGPTIFSYFPPGSKTDTTGAPYVYWDSGSYTIPYNPLPPTAIMFNVIDAIVTAPAFTNAGGIRPYGFDANGNGLIDPDENWVNPDSFQIIAAGADAKYGLVPGALANPVRLYPTGTNYDPLGADDDNVTNFCAKARLGDAKP